MELVAGSLSLQPRSLFLFDVSRVLLRLLLKCEVEPQPLLVGPVCSLQSIVCHDGFALFSPQPAESLVLLFCLLLEELLDKILFSLFGVESLLNLPLVDEHLPVPALALLAGKLVVVLGLLDFVHGGRVREVLDLPRRNALLFLLPLDGILDRNVLLDAQLLHVLLELLEADGHFLGVADQLFLQVVLVELDPTVLKVVLTRNLLGAHISILLPILLALGLPLLHELPVLLRFQEGLLAFRLLQAHQQIHFGVVVLLGLLLEVHPSELVLQKLVLDQLLRNVLELKGRAFHTVLLMNFG